MRADDIRVEWRAIRSAMGNLICYIDGKEQSLKDLDVAYQKGINDGSLDVKSRVEESYQRGLADAWKAARQIFAELDYSDVVKMFGEECAADNDMFYRNYSAQDAIEKLRELEDQRKVQTNAEKFTEVFGHVEGGGRVYADPKWWDSTYRTPEEAENHEP